MLSPGRHATADIPRMVAEAAAKHPGVKFKVTDPLGLDDKIGEVVLERAGIEIGKSVGAR
jgi:sirohydrochlorin ferrochelatase